MVGMSRRRRHRGEEYGHTPQATHWVWAGILGLLAGGIYLSFQGGIPTEISGNTTAIASSVGPIGGEVAATSSILLGVAVPKADRDQVFLLSMPGKTIEQQTVDKGWRIDRWKEVGDLHVVPASPDGRAPVITDGGEWNIPLRGANGEAYGDPQIAGKADAMHIFVTATTDARKLLLVSRGGEIRNIIDLPDFTSILPASDGHVWLATFVPGEGIESEPTGPSRLIRVSISGLQETIAEETRVIVSVTPGPDGSVAYRTDDGDAVVTSMGKRWSGNGIPLLWLDANRLMLARGRQVFILNVESLSLDLQQELPAAPSAARVL